MRAQTARVIPTKRKPSPYMSYAMSFSALPDPVSQAEFYSGVTFKRFLAWVIDTFVVVLMAAVLATLPLFIGWFFFPILFLVLNFIYRVATITSKSATWGMRILNIELRNKDGAHLEGSEAFLHTAAYLIASSFFLPQVISIVLMMISERGQGLHDMLCGTVAIRRPSKY